MRREAVKRKAVKRSVLCVLAVLMSLAGFASYAEDAPKEGTEAPRKVVYLTFDDGPKQDTPELVALLQELNVPATFFFVGLGVRSQPASAKLVADSGFAVGSHAMSHSHELLKADGMQRERERFNKEMTAALGRPFETDLFRFPGGSTGYRASVRRAVAKAGMAWFDWNAMDNDTASGMTAKKMYESVLKTAGNDDVLIVLMHEGKPSVRAMLPDLVAHFREAGFEFRALSTGEEDRAILAECGANMMWPEEKTEQEE